MRISITKLVLLGAAVTALVLFPADGLRALGLGEARVDSYLGQPLDVTIRLLEADSDVLDAMTVEPARAEDYQRLGVPSEALALGLEVSIDRRTEPARVRVRSQRAVADPVVRFLVDARWSSGRVLREYTLFLDPPTVEVAPPSPVTRTEPERPAEPAADTPEPVAEPAPAARRPAPAAETPVDEPSAGEAPVDEAPVDEAPVDEAPVEPPAPRRQSSPEEFVVGAGQTLWGIAADWRPSSRLTMNQVMLAIFERNPAAFDGNVNRLRRGARLNLPGVDDVEALSVAEADRRIREQMQTWRQQTGRTDVPVIAESGVPESARDGVQSGEEPAEDVVHRLDVIPPESDIFDEGPVVSAGEVRRASRRLAELEDEMYAEALENDELVRRIDSIREAIQTREAAGLAVADEELAEFEARLRQARAAREEAERLEADALAAEESAAEEAAAGDDDEIGSYFRQLEEEMGAFDSDTDAGTDERMADAEAGGADPSDRPSAPESGAEAEPDPVGAEQGMDEPVVIPDASISRSSSGSLWTWVLAGLGALVVLAAAVVAFVLIRRRGEDAPARAEPGLSVGVARERLRVDPQNLAAHLGLLKALAERDDQAGFSEALDDMYRQVDNDDNPQWQEALNLAVVQTPDHPLLTPHETGLAADDDEGLDERTREMLGILESSDDSDATPVGPDDYELDSDLETDQAEDDDFFSTEPQSRPPESGQDTIRTTAPMESDDDDVEGVDLDLAELSRRLDQPEDDSGASAGADDDDDTGLTFGSDDDAAGDSDSTRILPAVPEADEPDASSADEPGADDDLAADDPLRMDFEFSDRPSPGAGGRDATLPLTDDIDLTAAESVESEDDLDLDELGDDLAAGDDELIDLDEDADRDGDIKERGEREGEAFLRSDQADEGTDDEDGGAEPELSDEDAEVKLDLARAYLSMDDPDSARTLLEEIASGGSASMRAEARKLLDKG